MPIVSQELSNKELSNKERPNPDTPDREIDLVHCAVDHAIDLRETVGRIADPLLRTLTDMLLFELGRRLARLEGK